MEVLRRRLTARLIAGPENSELVEGFSYPVMRRECIFEAEIQDQGYKMKIGEGK